MIMGCLFFLTLTYFSIWWIVLAMLFGLACLVYRIHTNQIARINACKSKLEIELAEKSEQFEKSSRNEKSIRRKIEEIQWSKTTVLNKISHDIRNPMNSMMGMASLLEQTPLSTEQERYLETIHNCGKNMMTTINDILIKDMLNSAAGETGIIIPEQTDFDIRECIEDVLDSLSAKAEKTGIELLCQVGYDIPANVTGDESRLRQVLLNLIENAIKNTLTGEITVTVTLGQSLKKENVTLAFELIDTGNGITDDKLNKINMSLSNPDTSGLMHAENSGLGLMISNKLVTIMGGTLSIISKIKAGTRVLFSVVVSNSIIPQKRSPLDNLTGLSGKKILLVVNNIAKSNILLNHLDHWKFHATSASSGTHALEVLSSDHAFDLLITDLILPDMDGIQLTQKMRQLLPHLPAILMSNANNELNQEDKELFRSVLTKPVKQNLLYDQIVMALIPEDQTKEKKQNGAFVLSDKFSEQYPLRILIAEDDPMNQLFAVKILNRLGYDPDVAENGKEVLEMVSLERYDFILMDVEMPVMDGLEATRMIRLCLEVQPVIIAMTANAMQGDREICLKSGMDDYVSKPVELEELVGMLEKWALPAKQNL